MIKMDGMGGNGGGGNLENVWREKKTQNGFRALPLRIIT